MILHTINKPAAWKKYSKLIKQDDYIVLLEDGIYLDLAEMNRVYAIKSDVEARGFIKKLHQQVQIIDYGEFVKLCTQAEKICAWF